MRCKLVDLIVVLTWATGPAHAQQLDFDGSIGTEVVQFNQPGLLPSQSKQSYASLSFDVELRWLSLDRDTRFQLHSFGRWDETDSNRNHIDLREAYIARSFGNVELLAGVNKLFWGVTESRHLVDIINQVDNLEFNDRDARLGQPMVMATWQLGNGAISAIAMSGFREQKFPGQAGRFSLGLAVDTTAATFDASEGKKAIDVVLRYSGNFGGVDLGLSYFHGTSREATFSPNLSGIALVPHYARISQIGIDAQLTLDAILLKFEGIRRSGHGQTFNAAVVGAEYTFYQTFNGKSDLGIIGEYLYDGRDATAPVTPFDDDVFVGARWAANDTQDTSLLIGATIDLNDDSTFVRAEFERRLGDHIHLKVAAQTVMNSSPANPLYALRNEGFVSVDLSYNF